MKKGLTYISERTSQLRYSDNAKNMQWLQPLSTYIPIQEIKRGQPVSVATTEDLKLIAGDDEDLYNALINSSDSYVVLTNPSRHTSSLGLALEYTDGAVSLEDGTLTVSNKIHILGQGQYIEDRLYYWQAFTDTDNTNTPEGEYWPDFFNDYEGSIGKKVYVKGSTNGELTIVPEEAYLAHNNVIVIGFVTDANIADKENKYHVGAIEVQIEGDDRGIIDATTFEAVVGEDVYIGKDKVQANGEFNSYTKVFALGSEDDTFFKFSFDYVKSTDTTIPNGFIALQRWDGKTAFIYTNKQVSNDVLLTNESFNTNDRAFNQVAMYYAANCTEDGDKLSYTELNVTNTDDLSVSVLTNALATAMAFIAPAENTSLKDGTTTKIHTLNFTNTEVGTYKRLTFTADAVGGYFDVYISNNLTSIFQSLNVASHGSYYNKGYAVLADIRNPARQNIIGIYNSGHTGLVSKGENAIFMKQGLFTDDSVPYETGARYYLGSHGNIFKVPQEYYNSIISIGYAQAENKLIVDCCDSRQYNNGDLPVGYMKPSVNGEAEFGFYLMDGETPHKLAGAELLYQRLLNWYPESELYLDTYNFGVDESDDYAQGFIIPKVVYQKHVENGDTVDSYPAQIKYLAEGVYKELPRTPFVRRFVEFGGDESHTTLPDIDITSLMIYGPEEDRLQVPDLEQLDIKLFVNISDDTQNNERNWVQIEPGFHQTDNHTYYGFKWTVTQTEEPSVSHPYGIWVLRAAYSGTATADTADKYPTALGICYLADPYAAPIPLAGRLARVFVTKHDYYSRQFDVEALFKDYVKESVVDSSDTPWVSNAVSGAAVRNDILKRVLTKHLVLGQEYDAYAEDPTTAQVDGYVSTVKLIGAGFTDEVNLKTRYYKGDFRFSPADVNNTRTFFLDYYDGLLKYYFNDENDDATKATNKGILKTAIYANDYALLPQFLFRAHENLDIASSEPHGISNAGYNGNLNAKTLQSANLGFPQHILAANASESNTSYTEEKNTAINITIPYTEKGTTNDDYLTRLGNHTRYYDNNDRILNEYFDINSESGLVTQKLDIPTGNNFVFQVFGSKDNKTKNLYAYYDFYDDSADIKFYTDIDNNDPATLWGNFTSASSIKTKYAYRLWETSATPSSLTDGYESKFLGADDDDNSLNEALQAIYEMPLATFKYNRENDKDYFKKYFGIIVERVAETRDNVEANELGNKTTFDELAYTYTEDERKSIKEYLNLMTDNNEEGMRVASVVGILLKAAKETQERLLNLEISTYGKDSPTLPGTDEKNENLITEEQKSTVAGLNRLVHALCREVFQDADPTNIDSIGAWSADSENYSRLDMLDKEVNGDAAKDDSGQKDRIELSAELGATYPDDATMTQGVDHDHQVIKDEDNDDDFGRDDAEQYPTDLVYDNNILDTSSSEQFNDNVEFDGLNDAVNRIVAKVNTLTKNINGTDDIKQRPKKLDYIRSSLETVIRELYSDETDAADIEDKPFLKSSLSRVDKLLQDLYNFDLDYGETKLLTTFNNRDLYGDEITDGKRNERMGDGVHFDSFSSRSPEKITDIFNKASILDVIIDQIGESEKNLVRTKSSYIWHDAKNDETDNWKYNDNSQLYSTYVTNDEYDNNVLERHNKTIMTRLDDIEQALYIINSRFTNNTDFIEKFPTVHIGAGAYDGVTSIDDVMNLWTANHGLYHDKEGVYSVLREYETKTEKVTDTVNIDTEYDNTKITESSSDSSSDSSTTTVTYDYTYSDWVRTDDAKKKVAENWRDPLHGKINNWDIYDIVYDAITRLKNSEWNLAYNNAKLGTDYDDYVDTGKDKTTYERLLTQTPSYSPEYTITSDLKAVLKLLYGTDLTNADGSSNKTGYDHFLVSSEYNDNFTSAPGEGISVLDKLYNMLYNVPQAYSQKATSDGSTTTYSTDMLSGTVNSIYDDAIYYDPAHPKTHQAADNSLLGNGLRSLFIASSGNTGSPRNRIDILEDFTKAIYSYIGFGSTSDPNYFTGNLNITFGNSAGKSSLKNDYTKQKVLVNSSDAYNIQSGYNTLITSAGSYKLSAVALQGYFNTLDIVALLGSSTTDGWTYTPPTAVTSTRATEETADSASRTFNSLVGSEGTQYTIKEALTKVYSWIAKLDKAIIDIQSVNYEDDRDTDDIYNCLGGDYTENTGIASGKEDITTRLNNLEDDNTENREAISSLQSNDANLRKQIADLLGDSYKTEADGDGNYTLAASTENTVDSRLSSLESWKDDSFGNEYLLSNNATSRVTEEDDTNTDSVLKSLTQVSDTGGKYVKGSSVLADLSAVMSELQDEFKTGMDEAQARAALIAYLKCNSITFAMSSTNKGYLYVQRSGETETNYAFERFRCYSDSDTNKPTSGSRIIYRNSSTRFGVLYRDITLYDTTNQIEWNVYVPESDTAPTATGTTYGTNEDKGYTYTTKTQYVVTIEE